MYAACRAAAALIFLPLAAKADCVDVVEHYAGKDETCATSTAANVEGRLRRLVLITDYYSGYDRETYCTAVVDTAAGTERRFSASSAHCDALRQRRTQTYRFTVAGAHICAFGPMSE